MLEFYHRYIQEQQGLRSLPRSPDRINQMIDSEVFGDRFKLGVRDSKYFVCVSYGYDEYCQLINKADEHLSFEAACKSIFEMMDNIQPDFKQLNFSQIEKTLDSLPASKLVKYEKELYKQWEEQIDRGYAIAN